jgi:hypothetical protein
MAAAVALGAVPRAVVVHEQAQVTTPRHHQVGAAAHVVHRTAHIRQAATVAPAVVAPAAQPASAPVMTAHFAAAPASTTPTTKQPAHHKKHKKHHKKVHKPAAPKLAPRTTPSAAAVSSAISGLKQYVHTILTPTASQVAQFGDEVCSAFDKNETFAQIKSAILAKVQQLPFTTVTSGAADYVVKTAVKLYCPGYTSRVS